MIDWLSSLYFFFPDNLRIYERFWWGVNLASQKALSFICLCFLSAGFPSQAFKSHGSSDVLRSFCERSFLFGNPSRHYQSVLPHAPAIEIGLQGRNFVLQKMWFYPIQHSYRNTCYFYYLVACADVAILCILLHYQRFPMLALEHFFWQYFPQSSVFSPSLLHWYFTPEKYQPDASGMLLHHFFFSFLSFTCLSL